MSSENVEISKCLEGISTLMNSLGEATEGDVADAIMEKFSSIEENFPIIKSNVESYVTDFQNLIKKYNEQNSSISMGDVDLAKGGETVNVKG